MTWVIKQLLVIALVGAGIFGLSELASGALGIDREHYRAFDKVESARQMEATFRSWAAKHPN